MTTIERSCASSSLYSVKWESQNTHIISGIRNLLTQDKVHPTDLTIACDGNYFQTHKLLLSLCSSYFRDLIQKHCSDFTKTIIIMGNICPKSLGYILQFIYQGDVIVPEKCIETFLETGATLKINGLMNGDVQFTRPEKLIKLQADDIYDDLIYSKPPETPGKYLVRTSRKERKVQVNEKSPSFCTKPNHTSRGRKGEKCLEFSKNDQGVLLNLQNESSTGHTSTKSIVNKESQSQDVNPNSETTNNDEPKQTTVLTLSQVNESSDNKSHTPILLETQSNISDAESTESIGNILEGDEESISSSSEGSYIDENQKEPELIDLENDNVKETNHNDQPRQVVEDTTLTTIDIPTFQDLLDYENHGNDNEKANIYYTVVDASDINDKNRKCKLQHSDIQSLSLEGGNEYNLQIKEITTDYSLNTPAYTHDYALDHNQTPQTSLNVTIPIFLNGVLPRKRRLSSTME